MNNKTQKITPKSILKNIFGFEEFRLLQQEIIQNILSKKDTLIIMPTGSGKSLCYQLPALIFKGLTIVISPLISLMKDQVEQLLEMGVKAVFLNSSLSYDEYRSNINRILYNEVKLVYLAPEAILTQKILTILSRVKVECITIDEAHCISEWGHDFRPEYRQLIEVRKLFPKAICVALTATATPRVQKDIKDNLKFETSNEFISSFNRKNLFLQVVHKIEPVFQTIEFLEKFPNQSGIIYCFSRKQVDELTLVLEEKGFSVKPYHAGLSDEERKQNHELFIKDNVQIIVATIAFGMGINKPNIRFVVHFDLPKNIEGYYQEIGRAGRDGLKSHCLLLFSYGDIHKIKYFINQKADKEKRIANIHLNSLIRFCETNVCRRIPLLNYFGEKYSIENCQMCDNCLEKEKDLVDITIPAQKFLSCMKRTGEYFGTNHIIDILRGSKAQKVLDRNHNLLSTYGIGKDISRKQWFHLSRQFIQQDLIIQEIEFGSLKITKNGWEVLRNKHSVMGLLIEEKVKFKKIKEVDYEFDHTLFEILRKKRKEIADEKNIPPFIIFHDNSLIEMAAYFPQSNVSFMKINGVGKTKLEKYGKIFIDIITNYYLEFDIDEQLKGEKVGNKLKSRNSSKSDLQEKNHFPYSEIRKEFPKAYEKWLEKDDELLEQNYLSGTSIKELAKLFQRKPGAIRSRLIKNGLIQ
ncbi:MAG: DNA helicase RecQ [Candidatus Cloacimonetes bacterium]|nr:DNA helicase RecQ [Candidatus Cloacimonadota bacterium]